MIVFENAENIKICDVTQKQLREYAKPIKLGDAYVFMNGEMSKIKLESGFTNMQGIAINSLCGA
jgi:hypothetical protein